MSFSCRDLKVWQRSIELCVLVYKITGRFPVEELYGLTSQLRRASVSVASNIAEGYGRANRGDFRRFLGIARGSILEIETQLAIAKELGLVSSASLTPVEAKVEEIGKMLWSLMQRQSATMGR